MDFSMFWVTLVTLMMIVQNGYSAKIEESTDTEQIAKPTKQEWNPLGTLILNQSDADSSDKHEPTNESLTRVKRQYGAYGRRYPYPLPVVIFGGGFGRGFGGRGFGGRGGFGGGRGGFGGAHGGFGGGGHGGGGGRG